MNGLQSLNSWQTFMERPTGGWLGFINAINCIGSLVGLCFVGYVAERLGRKIPLLICITFISFGAGLGAGARNIAMFIIGRFFVGLGASFVLGAPLMIAEISYPTHRARTTSLYKYGFLGDDKNRVGFIDNPLLTIIAVASTMLAHCSLLGSRLVREILEHGVGVPQHCCSVVYQFFF